MVLRSGAVKWKPFSVLVIQTKPENAPQKGCIWVTLMNIKAPMLTPILAALCCGSIKQLERLQVNFPHEKVTIGDIATFVLFQITSETI